MSGRIEGGQKPASAVTAEWEAVAWRLLKEEMRKRKVTYQELSQRLEAQGIRESADRLNRKINRRRFSAAFFLACLAALDVRSLNTPAGPFEVT